MGVRKASADTLYRMNAREGSLARQAIPVEQEVRALSYLLTQLLRLLVTPQYDAIIIDSRSVAQLAAHRIFILLAGRSVPSGNQQ